MKEICLFSYQYTGDKGILIMPNECLFCKIIKGEIAADVIDYTDTALAFRDINPQARTHILVIPKKHIASTREFNKENVEYLAEMALLANKVSEDEGIAENGYRWVINTGSDGGQTVDHIHLHLIGGRKMIWPPG